MGIYETAKAVIRGFYDTLEPLYARRASQLYISCLDIGDTENKLLYVLESFLYHQKKHPDESLEIKTKPA